MEGMERILTGCIVGAGFMGSTHLDCYLKNPKVRIAGIVDSNFEKASKLAEKAGCRVFDSLDEMAKACSSVDFVDVCLPSILHRQYAVQAMEQGSHVIVEKPIATTLDDADAMIEASHRCDRRLMVAHVCRFMPQFAKAKELVGNGAIGRPISMEIHRLSDAPMWSWNNWLQNNSQSGGTLLDLSVHDLDFSNWLFGSPVSFKSYISGIGEKPGSSSSCAVLTYDSGVVSTVFSSHLMPKGYPLFSSFIISGTSGCIEWNTGNTPGALRLVQDGEVCVSFDAKELDPVAYSNAYQRELDDFIDCLINGKPFKVNAVDARLALETVSNLYGNATYLQV